MVSTFPETVFGFDIGLNIPIQLILALVVLFIFGTSDILHFFIIIVMKFIIG